MILSSTSSASVPKQDETFSVKLNKENASSAQTLNSTYGESFGSCINFTEPVQKIKNTSELEDNVFGYLSPGIEPQDFFEVQPVNRSYMQLATLPEETSAPGAKESLTSSVELLPADNTKLRVKKEFRSTKAISKIDAKDISERESKSESTRKNKSPPTNLTSSSHKSRNVSVSNNSAPNQNFQLDERKSGFLQKVVENPNDRYSTTNNSTSTSDLNA